MQEMINCLTEEIVRFSYLAELTVEPFKSDYRHKAELIEQTIEVLKKAGATS